VPGPREVDDPALTARLGDLVVEPLRVVLGSAPKGAKMRPCLELSGDLSHVLDEIASHDVLQLLVEGGPTTASSFLEAGLVNHMSGTNRRPSPAATRTLGALKGLSTSTIAAFAPRTHCQRPKSRRRYSNRRGGLMAFSSIEEAIDQLRHGGMVVVVDDAGPRERR